MRSLPVPLSPCSSTGTLVPATFSILSRRLRISEVRPNSTETGGAALTELDCEEGVCTVFVAPHVNQMHFRYQLEGRYPVCNI